MEDEQHSAGGDSVGTDPSNPRSGPNATSDVRRSTPASEDARRDHAVSTVHRVLSQKFVGTAIYVYFGLFVVFHVIAAVGVLLIMFGPLTGLLVWIAITVLGGVSVVALSLWRKYMRTFWD